MPYATKSDMQARYGDTELRQLTDITTPRAGAIVDTVLDRALADASAWIDSFLMGRYALPITDVYALPALNFHCCAEARYLLMTSQADESAINAHQERARYFLSVAKGDVPLIPPANVAPVAGVGAVIFNEGDKVMGRDSETAADTSRSWSGT